MKKLITEVDILNLIKSGLTELIIPKNAVISPLAFDRIKHNKIRIVEQGSASKENESFQNKRLAIGSDHTGVKAKKVLFDYLKQKGFDIIDIGTFTEDAVDYPDIAYNVACRVKVGEVGFGIILDATGVPSCITANKVPGIRAATCYNEFSARSSREHNNANVLVMGAKALGDEALKSTADVWLNSKFLGDRHQRRLEKIKAIEDKYLKS
ncbi:MAG: ribose-5-phosphate isomerase B [Ignavibacteria bacterium]|nr:MAG: ribose-5-phosphate isomerase B [Ignavibacteria bacterium]KAF0159717.1 MAG: ribose-5-phosphate isomerase B [Ignavibacteria bacterium]